MQNNCEYTLGAGAAANAHYNGASAATFTLTFTDQGGEVTVTLPQDVAAVLAQQILAAYNPQQVAGAPAQPGAGAGGAGGSFPPVNPYIPTGLQPKKKK